MSILRLIISFELQQREIVNAQKMLDGFEKACAAFPNAEIVASFCSHHGLQQETVIKAAWAHLANVYFDCGSLTFRLISLESRGSALIASNGLYSEQIVQLSPGVILESLKAIEQKSKDLRTAVPGVCYLQAEVEVDGDILRSLFCAEANLPFLVSLEEVSVFPIL
jgi:hypothetical protein